MYRGPPKKNGNDHAPQATPIGTRRSISAGCKPTIEAATRGVQSDRQAGGSKAPRRVLAALPTRSRAGARSLCAFGGDVLRAAAVRACQFTGIRPATRG